ncbi:unnamed protein product [Cercospora beticola]|nr:unnamed protein product [Cercospora beticola]
MDRCTLLLVHLQFHIYEAAFGIDGEEYRAAIEVCKHDFDTRTDHKRSNNVSLQCTEYSSVYGGSWDQSKTFQPTHLFDITQHHLSPLHRFLQSYCGALRVAASAMLPLI